MKLEIMVECSNDTPGFEKGKCYKCRTDDMENFLVISREFDDETCVGNSFTFRELEEAFEMKEKLDIPTFFLSDAAEEACYRKKLYEYTRSDIEGIVEQGPPYLDDVSDADLEDIIDSAAHAYADNGDYDCNLSYWDNIDNLLQKYTTVING